MNTPTSARHLMLTLALASSLGQGTLAQTVLPPASPAAGATVQITGRELTAMLDATTRTVIQTARAQGVSEADIQRLQGRLSTLSAQAATIAQQSPNGTLEIPRQALNMLAVNVPGGATGAGMSAQSAMQQQGLFDFLGDLFGGGGISLPGVPSFLGDGGLDTIIDYLINGLATAISMIPVVGGPLSEIIKGVGGSLKEFLINNALAGGVVNALTQAQQWYKQLQDILGYTDVNKLLGVGTKAVSDRLNTMISGYGGTASVTGGQTTAQQIATAVDKAQDGTVDAYQADVAQMSNDPYKDLTGYSKYTNPMTATAEISALTERIYSAKLNNASIRATGASLTAQAAAEEISGKTAENVGTVMTQGQIARTGAASATTTLGAMTIQTGLMAEANNLNAMNAAAITAMLKQVVASQDANQQATSAIVDNIVRERQESATIAQAQMKEVQDSSIEAAQAAAASVASLKNLSKLTVVNAEELPMPGPYGERSFMK